MARRHVAFFLATAGTVLGGCAGILGLGEPDIVDGSTDASTRPPPKDAARDATFMDAGDAGTGSDTGRKDASSPDTGVTSDAQLADTGTGQDAQDATPRADAGSDARSGFCATYVAPPDSSVVCDDFDEDPDAGALGAIGGKPGGALTVVEAGVYKSAPRSLLVTDNPPDGSTSAIDLTHPFAGGTTFTIVCDALITDVGPPLGATHIVSLIFANHGVSASATVYLNPALDGGVASWGVIEQDPADGGYVYGSHPPVSVPASGWVHVVLSVTGSPGHYSDTLEVNGTSVDSNAPLAGSFLESEPGAQVGVTYAKLSGPRQIYFDNVVLIAQ